MEAFGYVAFWIRSAKLVRCLELGPVKLMSHKLRLTKQAERLCVLGED